MGCIQFGGIARVVIVYRVSLYKIFRAAAWAIQTTMRSMLDMINLLNTMPCLPSGAHDLEPKRRTFVDQNHDARGPECRAAEL